MDIRAVVIAGLCTCGNRILEIASLRLTLEVVEFVLANAAQCVRHKSSSGSIECRRRIPVVGGARSCNRIIRIRRPRGDMYRRCEVII